MGNCAPSKMQQRQPEHDNTNICDFAVVPCGIDAAAVADLADNESVSSSCLSAVAMTQPGTISTIQDLPPLLLAHIFSKHLSWEDIHGSVSLVCKAWHQIAAEVTPEQLSFEFDLEEDSTLPSTDAKRPCESKSILQLLLSQPTKLFQRLIGQQHQDQQHDQGDDDADDHGDNPGGNAADQLQQQQFLQYLQNAPWERWVQQHGMQLQDFSMSITNLDSNCAAANCQLKETLLKALAESTTPGTALLHSGSTSSSTSSTPRAPSDSSSSSSAQGSLSSPSTPLSSSCSEFSETSNSSSSSSSNTTCASSASSVSSSTSSTTSTSSLQLHSLHLQVPLFEFDVLLLAHGVCARAPALKALSLVGYSNSGAVKTRHGGSRSSTTTTHNRSRSSRHRLPINRPIRSSTMSTNPPVAAGCGCATVVGGGGSAPPRGADLIPVGYTNTGSNNSPPTWSFPGYSSSSTSGRGGFITGSSLKQLMTAVPQLESLTFACRQLYKLNWLAPATQLTYLSLRDCSLGGDLVKQLAGLDLPKLRAVDLSGSKGLGGSDVQKHLQQLTRIADGQLQQVDISGWDLKSAGCVSRELPHLSGLQSLSVLRMECCGLKGWSVPCGQLPRLTRLSLSGNPLDSQGIAAVCCMTQLQHLELAQVAPKDVAWMQQQPGQGATCWSGMRPLPHLTSLDLTGNFWPDVSSADRSPVLAYRAFKHVLCNSIASMPRLARIDLSECKAPYFKTMHLLASLPPSVTEVVLDGAVDGIKRADVEALQELPRLQVLSACGCNVRDKHVGVLSGLVELRSLILRDNALGPEGLAQLVQGCCQLTLLDVTGNERLSSRAGSSKGYFSGGCGSSTSSATSSSNGQCEARVAGSRSIIDQLLVLRD